MKTKYITLIIFIFPFIAFAQNREIKIGEKCPDAILKMYNYKTPTAKLSDFKKDLIILDFWATWCGGCIKALKKYDLIQKEFKGQISILPVTAQSFEKIKAFWPKNIYTKESILPTVVGDTTLGNYFPHRSVPHEVWIDKNGFVIAITDPEAVTKKNIQDAIEGKKFVAPTLIYADYDFSIPLFKLDNAYLKSSTSFHSGLTGYLPGTNGVPELRLHTIGLKFDTVENSVRVHTINNSIANLYRMTLKDTGLESLSNRFLIKTKDSVRFFPKLSSLYREDWNEKNEYCYETTAPLGSSVKSILEYMRYDLNKFLNLNGRIEKMETECWVLSNLKTDKAVKNKSDFYVQDLPLILNNLKGFPPLLNESTVNGNTILSPKFEAFLNTAKPSLKAINEALSNVGLTIIPERRELDFFVISD